MSVIATTAAAKVATPFAVAVPGFVITENVQLAIVAGFFNLALNALTLIKVRSNKKETEQVRETTDATHNIIERRRKPRGDSDA